jgi:ABC-type multidrug transport system ATPase subunit
MTDLAIRAEGLAKQFGDVQALAGIDLEVPPGTVFGLLGPNGAGKTTAVRILTTILPPAAGPAAGGGPALGPPPRGRGGGVGGRGRGPPVAA